MRVPAARHRAARRRGEHGARRGAPAGPPRGHGARPRSGSSRGRPPTISLGYGQRLDGRIDLGGRGGDGGRPRAPAHRRQRHPPRGPGPRGDLQRGGGARATSPGADDLLETYRWIGAGPRARAPAPRRARRAWCPCSPRIPPRCPPSASRAPARTSSRSTGASSWAARSGARARPSSSTARSCWAPRPSGCAASSPREAIRCAGMTTLEAVLGRRPSFDETVAALAEGFREAHGVDARAGRARARRGGWRCGRSCATSTGPIAGRGPAAAAARGPGPRPDGAARASIPDAPRVGVGAVVLDERPRAPRPARPAAGRGQVEPARRPPRPGRAPRGRGACARCEEECGLRVRVLGLCGVIDRVVPASTRTPAARRPLSLRDRRLRRRRRVGGGSAAGSDAAEVRWVPLAELGRYDTTDGLADMIQRAVSLRQTFARHAKG